MMTLETADFDLTRVVQDSLRVAVQRAPAKSGWNWRSTSTPALPRMAAAAIRAGCARS